MTPITNTIGLYGLSAAVLVAAGTLLVSLAAVRFGSQGLYRTVRRGSALLAALFTLSSIMLVIALLNNDFSLEYVAKHTEKALPGGYKLAAFWAGQEGSILLWGLVLSVMGAIFAYRHRTEDTPARVTAIATVCLVVGFFAALMVFAANPFKVIEDIPLDGHGLNPMLQNPGMIAHPPLLFLGYAGFTIPFGLLIGVLLHKRNDSRWLEEARTWTLVAWIFLTAGIILAAQWAYVELGWGGYWAWDPVENASLLPWLTGTALLHSIITQRNRGMFKRWTAALIVASFILCIFGTYITRSGVVSSVHGFGKSMVGTFFGAFLIISILFSLILIQMRWSLLKGERALEAVVSREAGALAANILLVVMTAVTLLGTMWPAISAWFGPSSEVKTSFYNTIVLPMAVVLVAVMAISPMLTFGASTREQLMRRLAIPLSAAAVAVALMYVLKLRNLWAISSAVVVAVMLASVAVDVIKAIGTRVGQENFGQAVLRLLDSNHRRYGSHVVHVGVVLIVAGIAGSSLYGKKEQTPVTVGQSVDVGRYHVVLAAMQETKGDNYTAMEAVVDMTDTTTGKTATLRPQFRQYNKSENPSAEVAIESSCAKDLDVTLAGYDLRTEPGIATLQVIVNPLVNWIWAGGIILGLGALVCLLPKFSGAPVIAASPAPAAKIPAKRRPRAALQHAQ